MLIDPDDDPRYRQVTLEWLDTEPDRPARDVFVRLITLGDKAHYDGDLGPYLMTDCGDGQWRLTLRLRADFRSAYQFCPSRDGLLRGHRFDDDGWHGLIAAGVADATNPASFGAVFGNPGPSSVLELPDAPPQSWWQPRPGSAHGVVTEHLHTGQIFGSTRKIWVYTPPGYDPAGVPLPLIVLLDGDDWITVGAAPTVDNLIAEGRIPPSVILMVDAIDSATRQVELTDHATFLRFLVEELLPWGHAELNLTRDPARTVLAGQSFGGLMAAYAGLHASDRFGLILSQSGSFWWPGGSEFDVEAGALIRDYARSERTTARFYLETGYIEWLLRDLNRHFRDVLVAKGYDVTYAEYNGGHDYACWRGGLADGLIALLPPEF
ncbi:enterochelin esterase family protein [Allocatelliglobosispora scoriae]|uniref:Enterochelin esterase family protein n=1 Tax=Allocatelliglobosispora scoriae TaxID=643052 RepID=A0A841BNH4_9ACTN|nr:enterochelin esterase [Allocatelliglobosispora scoriae]MBB5868938.1 enterochelin esterase family protein [Allocatelliglobosispora scoriae]